MAKRLLWVATRKGLFQLDGQSGHVVETAFIGDPVTLCLHDNRDGAVYAALDHGHFGSKLHRSDDGGKSWQEVACPKYPPKPDDIDDKTEWSTKLIWALAAGSADERGRLWCGTIPGGLFVSDDRGGSWRLVEALWNRAERKEWFGGGADHPGIHSICVDPRDSRTVTVGVSCGGVWQTKDGGESWELLGEGLRAAYMPPDRANDTRIQDPHCIVQSPSHPDVMWLQHHNGIFLSLDCGVTWQEIDKAGPSTFGFATRVSPTDPNKAWFVPASSDQHRVPVEGKVVVTRTTDGGKSFEVLTEGLPQEHAYDLVYRHAFDLADDDHLAFGSTTGNLWLSDNGGNNWRHIQSSLPPIYAVHWAC